ncbi:MAG TPA: WbqC family protein [Bacteroidia bacterium]|nr:WbqC family protein [Bacteroidia bacterium]HNT80605.1 WbqC family protein [Bacteroidia bacterium]
MHHLFATACFPPISYLKQAFASKNICIDQHSNFQKQSIRNRYFILGPNGVQTLIIPLRHQNLSKTPTAEVQISSEESWQHKHWQALQTAYNRSPYFEFIQDDLYALLFNKQNNLIEFNTSFLIWASSFLEFELNICYSETFLETIENDFRNLSNQKNPLPNEHKYHQVFSYKQDFQSGLSCIDLICNLGKAANKLLTAF